LLVFLAAAVSDFYVPEAEMATEKIQSRAHDGLTIQLRNVPKLLGDVRLWAPEAFVISFKLETNENILLAKAAASLKKYKVDAVCSNQLQTIRDLVMIVEPDPEGPGIDAGEAVTGDETEPVAVTGVTTHRIEKGNESTIELPLIRNVVDMHGRRLHGDCESKRRRLG